MARAPKVDKFMSPILPWLAPLLVSAALLVIFAIAAGNARSFPRLRVQSQASSY